MGKLIAIIAVVSAVLMFFASKQSAKFPAPGSILPDMYIEPVQSQVAPAEFKAKKGKSEFLVKPRYSYEVRGLVVSLHHSKSAIDGAHRQWKDFFNVGDICIAWGDNLRTGFLNNFDFSSGDWTCYYQTMDMDAFRAFNGAQFSNNHVLADTVALEKAALSARIGDQIYMKGYLVDYSKGIEFERRTSTVRTDEGQGACEIIYLTNFKVLRKANTGWRAIFQIAKFSLIGCGVFVIGYMIFAIISSGRTTADSG